MQAGQQRSWDRCVGRAGCVCESGWVRVHGGLQDAPDCLDALECSNTPCSMPDLEPTVTHPCQAACLSKHLLLCLRCAGGCVLCLQGEAIAYNLREMFGLRVPVISVVIGEGGSGGALAIGCANRNLIMENAVYYVASPEACAAILWKSRAASSQVGGVCG